MKNQPLIYFSLIVIITINVLSQTTPCDIKYKDGNGIYHTRMIGLHEDLLLVSDTGNYKIINVEKIASIRFDNGNYFWSGAAIGASVGFLTGIVLYEITGGNTKKLIPKDAAVGITFAFTLPAAVLGSLVGLAFRNIDNYDLSQMHPYVKSKEIKFIMRDHAEWR